MCSVGKTPLPGTFPQLPALCPPESVLTVLRRPGSTTTMSRRGQKAPSNGDWGPRGSTAQVPGSGPQRIWIWPPVVKKMCISRVLSKRTMGRLEPEHRLTFSHCRRKGEKLGEGGGKATKKQVEWGVKGRVLYGFFPFFFLFFVFFLLQQRLFWRSKICKCYVKAFSK